MVCDRRNHGGDTQAVYAYAREDLDHWQSVLGRTLTGGVFGENLTTTGVDVNGAVIGERWRVGDELELAVTVPRIPCGTFRAWVKERGWLRTFALAAMPGTYLSVVSTGHVRAGDRVTGVHRPAHGVTVAQVFRAITLEPELLPSILAADELEEALELALGPGLRLRARYLLAGVLGHLDPAAERRELEHIYDESPGFADVARRLGREQVSPLGFDELWRMLELKDDKGLDELGGES